MTQIDLPQVSLARYVDLLKRRRWQVVPVSILGLLIGGIIAFFIPRYFVATTQIQWRPEPGQLSREREDPFGDIVARAKITIPLAVKEAMAALGWPEAATSDPYELSERVKELSERLEIEELGQGRDRGLALIQVTYRDQDGLRAAAFLNQLVASWIERERKELYATAERALEGAREEMNDHRGAYERYLSDRKDLEKKYRIRPVGETPLSVQLDRFQEERELHAEAERGLTDLQADAARKALRHAAGQQELDELPKRVPVDLEQQLAAVATTTEGQLLQQQIQQLEQARDKFREGTPQWHNKNAILQGVIALMQELIPPELRGDADGMMPNPAFLARQQATEQLGRELAELRAEIAVREAALRGQQAWLEELAEGFARYDEVCSSLRQAESRREEAAGRMQRANAELGRLTSQPTVRQEGTASVPPMPTDPNQVLVALIGCVIGLFAAIGLVLLLDMLQATFKTVHDVERGLDVPVLGGISYLETEAQRSAVHRRRRRATLVAAAVFVLTGLVVGIYFYDPARLPPFVRDLLGMLLGTA